MEIPFVIYSCDCCFDEIKESDYRYEDEVGITHYCMDCAFKKGLISDRQYLKSYGMDMNCFHAAIDPNGAINVWAGSKIPPWDRTNTRQRNCPEYASWRKSVFERDDFTCQDCGARGGNLNAHHIKRFRDFPKLRLAISNGITLCEKCHKNRHREGVDNGRAQDVRKKTGSV